MRSRAEDAVSKILEVNPSVSENAKSPSNTLETHLVGYEGYSTNLHIVLIQEFNIPSNVAHRLVRAYGGRAWDVLNIAREIRHAADPEEIDDSLIVSGFPYLEAEVIFAVRHDWAVRAEDILARRTRLAFLNKGAAVKSVPKVVKIMAKELHWDEERQRHEIKQCIEYLRHFGGRYPQISHELSQIRSATMADLKAAYRRINDELGPIGKDDIVLIGEMLNHPLSEIEIRDIFLYAAKDASAIPEKVCFEEFANWWNSDRCNPGLAMMKKDKIANVKEVEGSGTMFG